MARVVLPSSLPCERTLPFVTKEMELLIDVFGNMVYQIDNILRILQEHYPEYGFPGEAAEFTVASLHDDFQYSREWFSALITELKTRGCSYNMLEFAIQTFGNVELIERFDEFLTQLRPISLCRRVSHRRIETELKHLVELIQALANFHGVCVGETFLSKMRETKQIRGFGLDCAFLDSQFVACPPLAAAVKMSMDARYELVPLGTAYDLGRLRENNVAHGLPEGVLAYDRNLESPSLPRSGTLFEKYAARLYGLPQPELFLREVYRYNPVCPLTMEELQRRLQGQLKRKFWPTKLNDALVLGLSLVGVTKEQFECAYQSFAQRTAAASTDCWQVVNERTLFAGESTK